MKGGLFDPRVGGLGDVGGRGSANSMARPCVPISSPLTDVVYLLSFELFSWYQKRFRPPARPSDPDTMTNTALEATASSIGNDTDFVLQLGHNIIEPTNERTILIRHDFHQIKLHYDANDLRCRKRRKTDLTWPDLTLTHTSTPHFAVLAVHSFQ